MYTPYTEKQIKDAREAVTSGMSYREAAELAGMKVTAVYYWMKHQAPGIRNSFQKKYSDKQREAALAAIREGKSEKEAATIAGVPEYMLYSWKKKSGLIHQTHTYLCPEPGCGQTFEKSILYAQHLSTAHPHKTNPSAHIEPVPLTKGAPLDAPWFPFEVIVNRVIKYFEDKPQTLDARLIEETIVKYLKANPVKISTEDFMQMLRNLISENTQTKEELARLRKSKEEWQIRAGRALEAAQNAINR